MADWRHDFTQGAELNEGWQDHLAKRWAGQRYSTQQLMEQLERDRARAVDFTVDTRKLQMVPIDPQVAAAQLTPVAEVNRTDNVNGARVVLLPKEEPEAEWIQATGPVPLNAHAHQQVAAKAGIPLAYYKRMLQEAPDLLCMNVNQWWAEQPARRLVRTMDRVGRAWLSDRYRQLDNLPMLKVMVPALNDPTTGWHIQQCGLTDLRVHIEAVQPNLTGDVRVGDPVALAVKITNSEVAAGALAMCFGLYRAVCSNLALISDWSMRRVHLGRQIEDDLVEVLSDATLAKEDEVVFDKMRDVLKAMNNGEQFQKLLLTAQESAQAKLENPKAAASKIVDTMRLSDDESGLFHNHMLTAGDPTMWGLTNALTATARTLEYERKAELERAAGTLLGDQAAWKQYLKPKAA